MRLVSRLIYMGFQKSFAARLAMSLFLVLSVVQTLLSIGVWLVAVKSPLRNSTSEVTLLTYFVLIVLFQAFVWSGISRRVGDQDIRKGSLSLWLLKPVSYYLVVFLEEVSWRVLRSFITVPVFMILFLIFRERLSIDWHWFGVALLLFPLGYLILFLIQFIVGALSFWFEQIDEFSELVEVLMLFFSGVGIPVFMFPPLLKAIAGWLPFSYALFFPTMVAMGQMDSQAILRYVIIAILWISGLSVLLYQVWRLGMQKFGAEGI